jgi:hypothetical protein
MLTFQDVTLIQEESQYPKADFSGMDFRRSPGISRDLAGIAARQAQFANDTAQFAYGTGDTQSTLAALRVANSIIADYGLDQAYLAVQMLLEAHNRITAELLSLFCADSTDRLRRYGTPDTMTMQELDQYGIPLAQRVSAGANVGFPLRKYGAGLQWNLDYATQATTVELAGQLEALLTADTRLIQRQIKRGFYYSTNTTFVDVLRDGFSLPVKCLANADSIGLPVGPNGEQYASATHTHYMYAGSGNGDTITSTNDTIWSSLTTSSADVAKIKSDLDALCDNVVEHFNDGQALILINKADEVYFRNYLGVANGFDEIRPAILIPGITNDSPRVNDLDVLRIYNRQIGWYRGFQVWVKPWVVSHYPICTIVGPEPPLLIRVPERPVAGNNVSGATSLGAGDLRLVSSFPGYPFIAQAMERRFGVAVWNRVNGAVLDINHTGSYTQPTIN